jgi:hypothetical protein
MREQRSGIPLMIIALITLLLAAAAVVLIFDPFGWLGTQRDQVAETEDTQTPAEDVEPAPEPEPGPEPVEEPEPKPVQEEDPAVTQSQVIPASQYRVSQRDTLSEISASYWGDPNLWPLLYQENQSSVVDPDFLRPGQTISIPEWIASGSPITGQYQRAISEAHITAHKMYDALGEDAIGLGAGQPQWWLQRLGRERANKALWVLYSGLRYNRELLSQYGDELDRETVLQIERYIERFGYPPEPRS